MGGEVGRAAACLWSWPWPWPWMWMWSWSLRFSPRKLSVTTPPHNAACSYPIYIFMNSLFVQPASLYVLVDEQAWAEVQDYDNLSECTTAAIRCMNEPKK